MNYDALIFDIDGTLWNASEASARGWTAGLKALGIDRRITGDEIASVAGKPYESCVDILLPGLRPGLPELVKTLQAHEEVAVRELGGDFYPGAVDGVRELSNRYRVFLVSNCQVWYLERFLEFSGLRNVITGSDCYGRTGATKGEMLCNMRDDHTLKNPVYIGDTDGDRDAAREAGMEFIHVAWGFGGEDGSRSVASFRELMTNSNES